MPSPQDTGKQSPAVVWLATSVTLVAGVASCALIAVAMNADLLSMLRTGGPIVFAAAVLWWLLRERKPKNQQADRWGWLKRQPKRKTQLTFTRARAAAASSPPTAGPPSVESIRELKEGGNTWVPSETRRRT
ncbi:MAG: hypothetical protein NT069_07245 [Planctomycetota bacterium]|nr:hypothetical protein [Planctomycetota bacterium]